MLGVTEVKAWGWVREWEWVREGEEGESMTERGRGEWGCEGNEWGVGWLSVEYERN